MFQPTASRSHSTMRLPVRPSSAILHPRVGREKLGYVDQRTVTFQAVWNFGTRHQLQNYRSTQPPLPTHRQMMFPLAWVLRWSGVWRRR